MPTLKLRLTMDVEYDTRGTPDDTLGDMLVMLRHHAMDNGLLTGPTDAIVEECVATVEVIGREE